MLRQLTSTTLGLLISAFMVLALQAGPAAAAECKGKTKSACSRDNTCVYVGSYTRSDGVKVDAYCRNKGGNASAAKKSKTKKTAKKTTKKTGNDCLLIF